MRPEGARSQGELPQTAKNCPWREAQGMWTIALYKILSTLQSETPAGLRTLPSPPLRHLQWEFHFVNFFPPRLLGLVEKISALFPPRPDWLFYSCVFCLLNPPGYLSLRQPLDSRVAKSSKVRVRGWRGLTNNFFHVFKEGGLKNKNSASFGEFNKCCRVDVRFVNEAPSHWSHWRQKNLSDSRPPGWFAPGPTCCRQLLTRRTADAII